METPACSHGHRCSVLKHRPTTAAHGNHRRKVLSDNALQIVQRGVASTQGP